MTELLGRTMNELTGFAEADERFEEQVRSMEDTVLEYHRMLSQGTVDPLLKTLLEVELVSIEEKADQLAGATRVLANRMRGVFGLRPEGYSKRDSGETPQ